MKKQQSGKTCRTAGFTDIASIKVCTAITSFEFRQSGNFPVASQKNIIIPCKQITVRTAIFLLGAENAEAMLAGTLNKEMNRVKKISEWF